MAVELNIGDICSVRLEYLAPDNTIAFNILHYRLAAAEPVSPNVTPFSGVPFEDVGTLFSEAIREAVDDEWAAAASNQIKITGSTSQNIWPLPKSRQFHSVLPVPFEGEVISEALPLQDAPVLVKRSIFGQRWGIGRLFFVGCPESGQAAGILTTGHATLINDFGAACASAISVIAATYDLLFVPTLPSFDAGGVPRKLNIVEFELTDRIIKTQRRRRPGKGK